MTQFSPLISRLTFPLLGLTVPQSGVAAQTAVLPCVPPAPQTAPLLQTAPLSSNAWVPQTVTMDHGEVPQTPAAPDSSLLVLTTVTVLVAASKTAVGEAADPAAGTTSALLRAAQTST